MLGQMSLSHHCLNPQLARVRGVAQDDVTATQLVKHADVVNALVALVSSPLCGRDPNVETARGHLTCGSTDAEDPLIVFPTTNGGYGTKPGAQVPTVESSLDRISPFVARNVRRSPGRLDASVEIS